MNINNISLPYPVLGVSDDVLPLLGPDAIHVDVSRTRRDYTFTITLRHDNADILRLIRERRAEYTCEYSCPATMLRACEASEEPRFVITVPRAAVNKTINFTCFVSVKTPIRGYTNSGFNPDYEGATFDMERGDVLVAFPACNYDVSIRYDRLQAAGAFMQIRESTRYSEVHFDLSQDKIEILLPPALYSLYSDPRVSGAAVVMHASLVVNALTFALLHITDHEQTTWARSIRYRLETEDGFSTDDLNDPTRIPALAQQLLRDPYQRLFNTLINSNTPTDE